MAASRSTSKVPPTWVLQTRTYFLQFLHATRFPPGERHGRRGQRCASPEWVIMLIGLLAIKCEEQSYLGIHRMSCRFWKELCGRQVKLPPISESQRRERLKKIGYQLGTAPGYVLQISPRDYFESGCERR